MDIKRFSNPHKLVIIEFWSNACIPCEKIKPFLEKLEEIYREKLSITYINIANNLSTVEKYNIKDIPTFIFIKNQELIFRINGFKDNNHFEKVIREYL